VGTYSSNPRPTVDCSTEPSRTIQSAKQECDINFIVAQYRKTGVMPHMAAKMPFFGDVSEVRDFRESVELVEGVARWFGKLPAKVRAAFGHDPAQLMDAMSDPSREGELRELGLVGKAVEDAKAVLEAAGSAGGAPPA